MATFDERSWKEQTSWNGASPSPVAILGAFSSPNVSEWLRGRVPGHVSSSQLLQAGIAQDLHAQGLSGGELLTAVREAIGRAIRPETLARRLADGVEDSTWKNRFANLVSGRFTELTFRHAYEGPLASVGVDLEEAVTERSFLDFRLTASDPAERFALSINVKNAGRQMRSAKQFFGLEPEDTLPIATYKAFGSEKAAIPPLVYVFLVDWSLLERLRRAFWLTVLTEDERVIFRLLTSFRASPATSRTISSRRRSITGWISFAPKSATPRLPTSRSGRFPQRAAMPSSTSGTTAARMCTSGG